MLAEWNLHTRIVCVHCELDRSQLPASGPAACAAGGRLWLGPKHHLVSVQSFWVCKALRLLVRSRRVRTHTIRNVATRRPCRWGGSIYKNATDKEGLYHLYVTEETSGKGLNSWVSNSQIIHAVSKSPLGPFTKKVR